MRVEADGLQWRPQHPCLRDECKEPGDQVDAPTIDHPEPTQHNREIDEGECPVNDGGQKGPPCLGIAPTRYLAGYGLPRKNP